MNRSANFVEPGRLTSLNVGRAVLSATRRLAVLSPQAQRLSLVDAGTLNEVWGRSVELPYDKAFLIPESEDVALLGSLHFAVMNAHEKQIFELYGYSLWDLTRSPLTLALVQNDNRGLRLLRHLGGGAWQDETLSGWEVLTSAAVRLSLADDGSRGVVFQPTSIGLFVAPNSTSPMVLSNRCEFSSLPRADLRPVFLRDRRTLVLANSLSNQLNIFDSEELSGACPTDLAWITTELSAEPYRVVPLSDTEFVVLLRSGAVTKYRLVEGALTNSGTSEPLCDLPEDGLLDNAGRMAILCLHGTTAGAGLVAPYGEHSEVRIVTLDAVTLARVGSVSLPTRTLLQTWIDGTSGETFFFHTGGFGQIEVWDRLTGGFVRKRGVFVDSLKERLH